MRPAMLAGILVAGVAGGYLVGARGGSAPAAPPQHVVEAPRIEPRVVASSDPQQLRAMLREELAQLRPEPRPAHTDVEPSPTAEAAFEKARSLLAERIAAGTWSEADRDALRTAMTSLQQEQADEIARTLFPALNDGRLRLAYAGRPL